MVIFRLAILAFMQFLERDICVKSSWPEDKPRQKIVFSRCLQAADGVFPGLWVMLDREDIAVRVASVRYNQFLFLPTPHPMILWITVLYHSLNLFFRYVISSANI